MRRHRTPRTLHPSRRLLLVPTGGPAAADGTGAPEADGLGPSPHVLDAPDLELVRTPDLIEDDPEDHDLGLAHDLPRLVGRRRALGLLAAGMGAGVLVACGSSGSDAATTTTAAAGSAGSSTTSGSSGSSTSTSWSDSSDSSDSTTAADGSTEVPEETGGPYPADGTNGPNVLTESGVVRQDITTSFGDYSGTATGVPTTVTMKLLDVSAGGTPMAGAAVYLWHCTSAGGYSLYSEGFEDQNYLRGVQAADDDGVVTFTTIYPACYDGRWPHIHFEVYPSVDDATSASGKLRTSQIALPQATCEQVYATDGYEASVSNLAKVSLDTDLVFSDGYASQLATVAGTVVDGLTLSLNVGV